MMIDNPGAPDGKRPLIGQLKFTQNTESLDRRISRTRPLEENFSMDVFLQHLDGLPRPSSNASTASGGPQSTGNSGSSGGSP